MLLAVLLAESPTLLARDKDAPPPSKLLVRLPVLLLARYILPPTLTLAWWSKGVPPIGVPEDIREDENEGSTATVPP